MPKKGEHKMIIVCPECSTKFNINAERLPAAGAKVRCARCKHVFHTEKPMEDEVIAPAFVEAATEVSETEESETSLQQSETVEPSEPTLPTPEQPEEDAETTFSYDRFQELDSVEEQEESFTFATDDDSEDQLPDPTAGDEFSFTGEPEEDVSPIEKSIETDPPVVEEPIDTKATSVEKPEQPQQQAPEKKGGTVSAIIKVLLVLILGILVIGGVLVYMNGPDQLNQTIQQLLGQQVERPVQTGRISLANLEGRFIQNSQAGELFLIRGEATNDFSEPRAGIQVKGVIFDPNGKPLLQKTVFCGNPISEEDLQTLSFLELEKMMGNQFGAELGNMKIEISQTIPFDIVFKDLPQNLSEFSVKVTSSKPVTK
jgi:predicted Zn finger-like uncharacterized protein